MFLIAGLSLKTIYQLASPLASTGENMSRNRGPEPCDPLFAAETQIAINICKAPEFRELAEDVLLQDMKQQGGQLGVPHPAQAYINLASQKLVVPGLHQQPDDKPEPKPILVAGAIEQYAPDDMPDRPDDQEAADQHEVASLLQ